MSDSTILSFVEELLDEHELKRPPKPGFKIWPAVAHLPFFFAGILFHAMHWPGGDPLMMISSGALSGYVVANILRKERQSMAVLIFGGLSAYWMEQVVSGAIGLGLIRYGGEDVFMYFGAMVISCILWYVAFISHFKKNNPHSF